MIGILTIVFCVFGFVYGQNQCLNGGVLVLKPAANVDQLCLCNKNFIGSRCETNLLYTKLEDRLKYGCELRPCWIGSTCEDRDGSFVCHCSANTFGTYCEKSSLTINDPCISKPCYNYGMCVQQDQNSYTCACNGSYGGLGCRQNLVGACASNPCQRDGICMPIGLSDYKCQCPEWTIGKNCEVVFNPCQRVNCMNNGVCLKRRTLAFECNCTSDFTGILCDQPKQQSCLTVPCKYGQCILGLNGQYQCACATPGYEGQYCEIERCNPKCKFGYCNKDQSGNYYCVCGSGYRGPSCSNLVCFSANNYVDSNRGRLSIAQLRPGDLVRTLDESTGQWTYSKFLNYLHVNPNITGMYVHIRTSGRRELTISPYHYIARRRRDNNKQIEFVFASALSVNDRLVNAEHDDERVLSVEEIVDVGAYAPLTESGTLAVNSLYVSCYANTISHYLAHYLFKPYVWFTKYVSGAHHYDYDYENHHSDTYGFHWYAKFFYNLLPYIPFSSKIIYF